MSSECPIKYEPCNLCVRHTECRSLELFCFSTVCAYLHTCVMREDWGLTRTTVKTTALVIFLFAVRSESLRQKQACTVQSTVYLHNVEVLMEFYRRKSIRRTFMNVCRCGHGVRRGKSHKGIFVGRDSFSAHWSLCRLLVQHQIIMVSCLLQQYNSHTTGNEPILFSYSVRLYQRCTPPTQKARHSTTCSGLHSAEEK